MDFTQAKGNITELQCISAFMEYGIECSIPYGNGAKYDFIADVNGELLRIQCKSSCRIDDNSFHFSCSSSTTNTQKTVRHSYDKNQIDYFATYYNDKVYLVPVEECSTHKTLRFTPPLNCTQNYNSAEDYEIQKVLYKKFNISELEKPLRKEGSFNKKKYYCAKCGKIEVKKEGKYCSKCYRLNSRVTERPPREVLKKMIRENSFLSIGKNYGVSGNAIVKWCEWYHLPSKKKDILNFSDQEWETV